MIRLGILGSTRGTHLLTILDAIRQKKLNASIEVVVSNKTDSLILKRAQEHGLAAEFIAAEGLTREYYDQQIATVLQNFNIDLVVLIGYMRILSSEFISQWKNKIINIHPSLLPAFAGKMDLAVHQAVLDAAVKETGCTVHYVTDDVDAGPIILQKKCLVTANDTAQSLKERVQQLEADALVEAINIILSN